MKNNTKIRLHLSKQLFESLTKQVIAEGKRNFGPGMEEVKMPSKMKMNSKKEEGMKDQMEEMSSKEKMAKGLYKEADISDYGTIGTTPDEMKTALQVFFGIVTLLGSAAGWNWLKAHFKATPKVLQMAAKEAMKKGIEVPKDMQVPKDGSTQDKPMDESILGAAAVVTAIGAGLAKYLKNDAMKVAASKLGKKSVDELTPEEKKQAISAIRQAVNDAGHEFGSGAGRSNS